MVATSFMTFRMISLFLASLASALLKYLSSSFVVGVFSLMKVMICSRAMRAESSPGVTGPEAGGEGDPGLRRFLLLVLLEVPSEGEAALSESAFRLVADGGGVGEAARLVPPLATGEVARRRRLSLGLPDTGTGEVAREPGADGARDGMPDEVEEEGFLACPPAEPLRERAAAAAAAC